MRIIKIDTQECVKIQFAKGIKQMKKHTTKKYINSLYDNRIKIGYCNLQMLLSRTAPAYYTTRAEGWGADIYIVNSDTVIITGYAPWGNITVPYDTQRKYNKNAEKITYDYTLTHEQQRDALNDLINEFISEVTQ